VAGACLKWITIADLHYSTSLHVVLLHELFQATPPGAMRARPG
jgi:hypothetical protein